MSLGWVGWGKTRAMTEPLSWVIDFDDDGNRSVTELDSWVDTFAGNAEARDAHRDEANIVAICNAIYTLGGEVNQTQLGDSCAVPAREFRKVLVRYVGKYWSMAKGERNASIYSLTDAGLSKVDDMFTRGVNM